MSLKFDQFPIRPLTAGRFWSWLARAEPGATLEYHRGHLTSDRSPASELAEDERRVVARLADAALQSLRDFGEQQRLKAAETAPTDRTFSDWVSVVEIPNDSKGTDLLEHLTRFRDEVAASVGG